MHWETLQRMMKLLFKTRFNWFSFINDGHTRRLAIDIWRNFVFERIQSKYYIDEFDEKRKHLLWLF